MHKHLFTLLIAMFTLFSTACARTKGGEAPAAPAEGQRILVAYFSCTGHTASAARRIAALAGGDLYEIKPAKAYTAADLNWENDRSRSSLEMTDDKSRPALGGKALDTKDYDVIFLGYPIWWDLAPRLINTFLETHDLKGKRVIPFATSGSSSITHSADMLRTAYPAITWGKGLLMNDVSDARLKSWVAESLK